MALKVTTAPTYTGKLTVSNAPKNYIVPTQPKIQSTVNPQQAAAPKNLPKANVVQTPKPAAAITNQATKEQIQAAAARAAEAARIAAAKQKEVIRKKVQGQVDQRQANYSTQLKLKVNAAVDTRRVEIGRLYHPKKLKAPEFTEDDYYRKIRDQARAAASKNVDYVKGDVSSGFLGRLVDKVTFGSDRRQLGAREYAAREGDRVADSQVKRFESAIDEYYRLDAQLKAQFARAQETMNATQLNTLSEQLNAKLDAQYKKLRYMEAWTQGTLEAFGKKSSEKLTSFAARGASTVNQKVIQPLQKNRVWKYTLGEGSQNIPSIVTAPSRAVNLIGNLNTKDRTIYQTGGTSIQREGTNLNAWQSTFNQRNFNIRPHSGDDLLGRGFNTAAEFVADPLTLLAAAKAVGGTAKGIEATSRAGAFLSKTRVGNLTLKTANKAKVVRTAISEGLQNNKVAKFLLSEYKTPEEQLFDAIDAAKAVSRSKQDELLSRINAINTKLAKNEKIDLSVFDDLRKLTDSEAAILQRMAGGKLTVRDRIALAGKNSAPVRDKIVAVGQKWEDFAEKMRLADNVENTRFGRGKRIYTPRTNWLPEADDGRRMLEKYNFKRFKKHNARQGADDLYQSAVDRYFNSSVDDLFLDERNAKRLALKTDRKRLLDQYQKDIELPRERVRLASEKVASKTNKIRRISGAPTRLWKKSVLKYRPAWTVNNVLYNTQAGVLSSGSKFLLEQAKMLRPKYARKAFDEIPSGLKTKLGKEVGTGRLSRFYNKLENNQRLAAFNALRKKGVSEADAIKRVDKYFFDYTVKNWERPIKAAVPFWSFQKNLIKASAQMPFDRPIAAKVYHNIDKNQRLDFDKQFQEVATQLKDAGYTDDEIAKIKEKQANTFAGKLRIGDKYFSTPFNAFSEDAMSRFGFNPYLAAAGETADSQDSFGREIGGADSNFWSRLISKFPQAEIARKSWLASQVENRLPEKNYIGEPGSSGFGLTKTRQGYDPSKSNYDSRLDDRTKNRQDLAAFFGKPREYVFDKNSLVKQKRISKMVEEYFANSDRWKAMEYDQAESERTAFFEKHGFSSQDFYAELGKYDSDHTKNVKKIKEQAREQNKKLFEEYAAQPEGRRNIWATQKLKELNDSGYFDQNPHLKGFDWINSESYQSAANQKAVLHALATGDWSEYRKLHGTKKTEKQLAREFSLKTGDWSQYREKYGVKESQKRLDYLQANKTGNWVKYHETYGRKTTQFEYNGKYFKSDESRQKYIQGEFWTKYADATPEQREKMLQDNPSFNTRADWTWEDWRKWRSERKKENIAKVKKYEPAAKSYYTSLLENKINADRFSRSRKFKKTRRVAYS